MAEALPCGLPFLTMSAIDTWPGTPNQADWNPEEGCDDEVIPSLVPTVNSFSVVTVSLQMMPQIQVKILNPRGKQMIQ